MLVEIMLDQLYMDTLELLSKKEGLSCKMIIDQALMWYLGGKIEDAERSAVQTAWDNGYKGTWGDYMKENPDAYKEFIQ